MAGGYGALGGRQKGLPGPERDDQEVDRCRRHALGTVYVPGQSQRHHRIGGRSERGHVPPIEAVHRRAGHHDEQRGRGELGQPEEPEVELAAGEFVDEQPEHRGLGQVGHR
jgi:hypothetical protein